MRMLGYDCTLAFLAGLRHAVRRLGYDDGCLPSFPRGFILVVPGLAFSCPAVGDYRDGWLFGKEVLSF